MDERKELDLLSNKYPDHTLIIVHMESNLLKLTKNKFVTNNDIKMKEFIKLVKDKLQSENGRGKDSFLEIKIKNTTNQTSDIVLEPSCLEMTIGDLYNKYHDSNCLKLMNIYVSRLTTYKYIKDLIFNIIK